MVHNFKAEKINGEIVIKPIISKNKSDIRVIVPSFKLIKKLKQQYGERNIQQI